jgi:hypothetical protein
VSQQIHSIADQSNNEKETQTRMTLTKHTRLIPIIIGLVAFAYYAVLSAKGGNNA